METPPGPRLEALCALCIRELYAAPRNCRRIMGEPYQRDMDAYPSKIIGAVLAGTHTVTIVDITGKGDGLQLTFKAVTVYQATDLCASHVTMVATNPYYPREYTNR